MYQRKIEHGVAIVATGAREYQPTEFRFGEDRRVLTQLELGRFMRHRAQEVNQWNRVVMIQCVGSRNAENPTCSRICCQSAVKNALLLKELKPEMEIVILYRDMTDLRPARGLLHNGQERRGFVLPVRGRSATPSGPRGRRAERQLYGSCPASPLQNERRCRGIECRDGSGRHGRTGLLLKSPPECGRLFYRGSRQAAPGGFCVRGHLSLWHGSRAQTHQRKTATAGGGNGGPRCAAAGLRRLPGCAGSFGWASATSDHWRGGGAGGAESLLAHYADDQIMIKLDALLAAPASRRRTGAFGPVSTLPLRSAPHQ